MTLALPDRGDWQAQAQLSMLDELANYAADDLRVCLEALARTGQPFTYESAVERLPARIQAILRAPEQAKNAGNIMNSLRKAKIIKRTGGYVASTHPAAHSRPVAVWVGV